MMSRLKRMSSSDARINETSSQITSKINKKCNNSKTTYPSTILTTKFSIKDFLRGKYFSKAYFSSTIFLYTKEDINI